MRYYCALLRKVIYSTSQKNLLRMLTTDSMKHLYGKSNIYHEGAVGSTMTYMREILRLKGKPSNAEVISVVADEQWEGRGTRGAQWMSPKGNLFMTMAFSSQSLPIPFTLMPLRLGYLIASVLQHHVVDIASMRLKWPNDILLNNRKICGILIEVDDNTMLVGVGCNIHAAPEVATSGPNAGRPSACIAPRDNLTDDDIFDLRDTIAVEITASVERWLNTDSAWDSCDKVVSDFSSLCDFSTQLLGIKYREQYASHGIQFVPIRINNDGTLLVRFVQTGVEKTLSSEYLY